MTRDFIINSLLPYKDDPSKCGLDGTRMLYPCMYLTHEGKKCAVGQYLKPGEWQQFAGPADSIHALILCLRKDCVKRLTD